MPEEKVQTQAQSTTGFWIVLVILILLMGIALFWWFGKNSASTLTPKGESGQEKDLSASAGSIASKSPAKKQPSDSQRPEEKPAALKTNGISSGNTDATQKQPTSDGEDPSAGSSGMPPTKPSKGVIEFQPPGKKETADSSGKEAAASLMDKRKVRFGVEEKMDLIARSDETVQIGEFTVPMEKIREQIKKESASAPKKPESEAQKTKDETLRMERGLTPFPPEPEDGKDKVSLYGIYVVKPGDNIWNIHFNLLKHFFEKKRIRLPPMADEPQPDGCSTGVGRVLKFSEKMVHIYNLLDGRLEDNLDVIRPLTKIVVYNMEHLFELFDKVEPDVLNRVEYDGQTLWLPKG